MSSRTTPPFGRPPYVRPQTARPQAARPQAARPQAARPQVYVTADTRTARAGAGVLLADRRGLSAAGGVVLSVLLGVGGATFDVLTGSGLRMGFAICFVTACVLTTLTVHREDLAAAVVMPPLVYVALSLAIGALARTANSGPFVLQQAVELVNAVVLGAPVLLLGTAAAALVAGARWLGGRGA